MQEVDHAGEGDIEEGDVEKDHVSEKAPADLLLSFVPSQQSEVRRLVKDLQSLKDLADAVLQVCQVHFVYLQSYLPTLSHMVDIIAKTPDEIANIILTGFKSTKPAAYDFMDASFHFIRGSYH